MRASLRTQRLIALCVAGAVMFNFPLLTLWDTGTRVFGLPALGLALFAGWGVLIACAAWIVRLNGQARSPERDDADDDGLRAE